MWINEAMIRRGTSTRALIREHVVTAEAEAGTAEATNHFVTFEILRLLAVQGVFGDRHPTSRALLCARFSHPPSKLLVAWVLLGRLVLRARKVRVVWLRFAQKTTSQAAKFT